MTIFSEIMRITTHLALSLAFLLCSADALQAQEERAANHTITLTKVVEVYEFEDVKVFINLYEVRRGDSISDILRERGVLDAMGDEARMLRLVKNLNPELSDLNKIQPGQVLQLPTELAGESDEAYEAAPVSADPPIEPATVTDTVKVYERSQPGQQSAKIVVMRHRPGQGTVELASGAAGVAQAAATSALDFPSGNSGPLAMEPGTGVVYRTVKIRRGDTLERLLRREGMDNGLIYAHLLKLTLELNPEIQNQDLIFTGAELRIPASGDYLAAIGANPAAVKEAALARAEGRKPEEGRGVLDLPNPATETAKNSLAIIFTRLGGHIDMRGRLVVPRKGLESIEFNTAQIPMVELPGERRVILDLERRLSYDTARALRAMPGYGVFWPIRGDKSGRNFQHSLRELWPLCGFYRVYDKEHPYEGGTDIKLRIAADWMIWPTEEAWKNGQPLVLNLPKTPDVQTDAAWKGFLAQHGIEVLDLYQVTLLPDTAPPPVEEPKITTLTETNPSLLAAELVKILGGEPRVGVQLDAFPQTPSAAASQQATAPVLWTDRGRQVVLNFGELAPEAVATMRESGYLVVEGASGPEDAVAAVLKGFGLKFQEAMVLKAPSGGPEMSLSLKGLFVTEGRPMFFTSADLPKGIAALLPPGLEIFHYQM